MNPCFPSILIATLLAAPTLRVHASPQQQTSDYPAPQKQDAGGSAKTKDAPERDADGVARVYDRDHRDYHRWDNAEDRAYRAFWQEHHRAHRAYSSLNRREQSHYWKWRHSHSDNPDLSSDSGTQ
jgi:hypothetical protein